MIKIKIEELEVGDIFQYTSDEGARQYKLHDSCLATPIDNKIGGHHVFNFVDVFVKNFKNEKTNSNTPSE